MREHNYAGNRGHGYGHSHGHHDGSWEDLAESMEHASRLLSHCLGSRRGQGRILRILCGQECMSQKELQDILHIQPGSMSEIAAKLESKGLIARSRDGADKRKILLSVTDKGRTWVAQRNDAAIRQQRAALFSSLSQEEQTCLRSLLERLSADWDQRLENEKQ